MKIIGLDVGTVRIGVAKADSKVKIAVPAGMVPVDGEEFEAIARLARVYGTSFFVLGLPRNNSGKETQQSAYVREFADTLKAKIPGAKVYFQDESLTSVAAAHHLAEAGRKSPKSAKEAKARRKSGELDSEAAVIILQDFLEHFAEKIGEKLPKEAKKNTSKGRKRHESKKSRLKITLICLFLTLFLLCGGVAGAVFAYFQLLEPSHPTNECSDASDDSEAFCGDFISISIPEGSSTAEIANLLAESKIIQNSLVFQIFTKLNGYDGTYRAGSYLLSASNSVSEIAEILKQGPDAAVFRLTVLPGGTIRDFTASLMEAGYDAEDIAIALKQPYDHPVLEGKPTDSSLEGYLYGETYEFFVGESVENIITTMLDQLYEVISTNNLTTAFAEHNLSLYQAITLASVVQKEAKPADMPTVAQVFLNRLDAGMPMGSDVTTQYSLDLLDPERTTYTDNAAALEVDECHNTRKFGGLPCGPISNPGIAALFAVAHPKETSALYFLTGDDGIMYYSNTEVEHNAAALSHCQVLCNVSL